MPVADQSPPVLTSCRDQALTLARLQVSVKPDDDLADVHPVCPLHRHVSAAVAAVPVTTATASAAARVVVAAVVGKRRHGRSITLRIL